MNFLEKFLTGHKLKLVSRKVHVHLIHNSCIAHSQMTKNNKNKVGRDTGRAGR